MVKKQNPWRALQLLPNVSSPPSDVSMMSVSFCVPGSPVEKKRRRRILQETLCSLLCNGEFPVHLSIWKCNVKLSTLHCGIQYSMCGGLMLHISANIVGQSMHIQYSAQYKTAYHVPSNMTCLSEYIISAREALVRRQKVGLEK